MPLTMDETDDKIYTLRTEIVLVDIVGFSKRTDVEQYQIVRAFEGVFEDLRIGMATSQAKNKKYLLSCISTGDGFYAVLHPGVFGYGVPFALGLWSLMLLRLEDYPNLFDGVRIAVHAGVAIPFKDLSGTQNFLGSGMNDTARLLSFPATTDDLDRAISFAESTSYVVASEMALRQFHRRYQTDTVSGAQQLSLLQFSQSERRQFEDKHGKLHPYHCIRCNSHILWSAPAMAALDVGNYEEVEKALRM